MSAGAVVLQFPRRPAASESTAIESLAESVRQLSVVVEHLVQMVGTPLPEDAPAPMSAPAPAVRRFHRHGILGSPRHRPASRKPVPLTGWARLLQRVREGRMVNDDTTGVPLPDWDLWRYFELVTLRDAVALSLNISPHFIPQPQQVRRMLNRGINDLRRLPPQVPDPIFSLPDRFLKDFSRRWNIAASQERWRANLTQIRLDEFGAWAMSIGLPLPADFPGAVHPQAPVPVVQTTTLQAAAPALEQPISEGRAPVTLHRAAESDAQRDKANKRWEPQKEAETWVLVEWDRHGQVGYGGKKIDFARAYSKRLLNERGLTVTDQTIAYVWLKGK